MISITFLFLTPYSVSSLLSLRHTFMYSYRLCLLRRNLLSASHWGTMSSCTAAGDVNLIHLEELVSVKLLHKTVIFPFVIEQHFVGSTEMTPAWPSYSNLVH